MKVGNIRQSLRLIWEQLRIHPIAVALMLVSVVIVSTSYIIEPYILKLFVDSLTAEATDVAYWQAMEYVGILAGIFWLEQFVFHIGARSLVFAEIEVINGLYRKAYDYIQNHSSRFFAESFAGSIVKRINRAVDSSEQMIDEIWFTFFPVAIRLIFMLGVLLFYSFPIFIVLLIGVAVFIGFTLLIIDKWAPLEKEVVAAETNLTGKLVDAIANNVTVKSFAKEKYELKRVSQATLKLKNAQLKSWTYFWTHINFPQGVIWIVFLLSTLIVSLWLWREGSFTVGDIVFIQAYLISLGPILWQAVNRFQDFKEASVNMSELHELLNLKHGVIDALNAQPLKVMRGEIDLRNVQFSYTGTEVFNDLSFTVSGGEKIAFVGHSGSGKSTIVKLLFRLYDIQYGSINIDGQNIAGVTQQSLRHQIGLVPQDPVLFHRTIKENLSYGNPTATQEEIVEAARKAHAHEFIKKLPKAYDTLVGERGIKLSGGERQRVAIARAFLENAPIIVFDEATSSLDSLSEQYIQEALDELMKDRTVIVIAHRLSTVVKMDRIIVFNEGKIVEEGTHFELLMKTEGKYKQLWDIQTQSL